MRLFKRIVGALADPSKSYEERTYVMLSILGVSSMFIALFFDMLGQENPVEVITIACAILFIPLVVALSVHFRRVQIGSFVNVCALVLIILPVTFFRGGGIKGGGVYWIIFSYMFIGMSLSGRLRVLMMTVLTSLAVFEFWSAFRHPEWIYQHTLRMNI